MHSAASQSHACLKNVMPAMAPRSGGYPKITRATANFAAKSGLQDQIVGIAAAAQAHGAGQPALEIEPISSPSRRLDV